MKSKKIKVRAVFGAHQIYQEIANNPPKGVEYSGITKKTASGKYYQSKKITSKLSKIFQFFHVPRMTYLPNSDEDLIHSSRGILILNKKPWVMDIEHPASFSGMSLRLWGDSALLRKIVKSKLESDYCKKIMFHCKASLDFMKKSMDCSKIEDKMTVLYPATHIIKLKRKAHKKTVILAVLSLFYEKGGLQALEAFSKLEKKHNDIELWIKSDVPEEIKNKYNSQNIKYFPYKSEILTREQLLKKYYADADIFLYPTFADTFGYSLLDAMIAKLPIIASDNFVIPEIVENDSNGFIVHTPISYAEKDYDDECRSVKEGFVEALAVKLSALISNRELREKMGKKGFKLVKEGKFSIKARNKKLEKIYMEAVK